MLTTNRENKSIHVSSKTEEGKEAFVAHASYSTRNINITFEMLDEAYCAANRSEVEEAISAFVSRLNAVLSADELPQVKG